MRRLSTWPSSGTAPKQPAELGHDADDEGLEREFGAGFSGPGQVGFGW
ncbi:MULTISPECIES: hypothetical protein [Sorangium]|nr:MULTISPECIES: hypothetical protein [Sorangium]